MFEIFSRSRKRSVHRWKLLFILLVIFFNSVGVVAGIRDNDWLWFNYLNVLIVVIYLPALILQMIWGVPEEVQKPVPNLHHYKVNPAAPKTPVDPNALDMYDHLTPELAAVAAWIREGDDPYWHRSRKEVVAVSMPLLARALDRMVNDRVVR